MQLLLSHLASIQVHQSPISVFNNFTNGRKGEWLSHKQRNILKITSNVFFCWTAAQQVVERGSPDHHTPHHSPDHIQETDRCVCPAILRRQCSWISVRQFSLFLNGLEYHQPFFTFFAATLKCIEKRPNLAVL